MSKGELSHRREAPLRSVAVGPMAGVGYGRQTFAERAYAVSGQYWAERSAQAGADRRLREETRRLMPRPLSRPRPA